MPFKFFEEFPTINYDSTGANTTDLLTNILKRVRVRKSIKNNISVYTRFDITDGDTPESLAYRFYDDPGLHWIFLLMNDVIDPFYGWMLSIQDLRRFITNKYGKGNENAAHHYEIPGGFVVNSTAPSASTVTNTEHETKLNEDKRRIKVLDPDFVGSFITEYKKLIKI